MRSVKASPGNTGQGSTIGDNVTIGHGAILNGVTIEDESFIGIGAILQQGVKVCPGSLHKPFVAVFLCLRRVFGFSTLFLIVQLRLSVKVLCWGKVGWKKRSFKLRTLYYSLKSMIASLVSIKLSKHLHSMSQSRLSCITVLGLLSFWRAGHKRYVERKLLLYILLEGWKRSLPSYNRAAL